MHSIYASILKKYSSALKPIPVDIDDIAPFSVFTPASLSAPESLSASHIASKSKSTAESAFSPESESIPKPEEKKIKAIFFDLYGTLFISDSGNITSSIERNDDIFFYKTFKICQIKDFSNKEDINKFSNRFYRTILEKHTIEKINGNETPEVDIRDIWLETLNNFGVFLKNNSEVEKIAVVYESLVNKTWPMPGLKNILSFISKKGIPMGIISNAQFYSEYLFEAYLKKSPLKLGFIKSLCYYSYNKKIAKPGKEMFEEAISEIKKEKNIISEEILYVGNDMLNDIKPAALLGMKTCLFAGDKRSFRFKTGGEEIKNITPDYVITELCMLKDILVNGVVS